MTSTDFPSSSIPFADGISFNTLNGLSPVIFSDDFAGASLGAAWGTKIVGSAPPTVALITGSGGLVQCALTSTSEKEDAALYQSDHLGFDIVKGLVLEVRAAVPVLPSTTGVQAVFGLSSAWVDGPNNATSYLGFGLSGSGALQIRSQDGTTQNAISTGITLGAGDFHFYRIDARNPIDCKFYFDTTLLTSPGQVQFAARGSASILQPYCSVYKPSGTGVATLTIDYLKIGTSRN